MKKNSLSMTALFALAALLTTVCASAQNAAVAPAAAPQQVITTDAAPVQVAAPAQTAVLAQTATPARTARPSAPRHAHTASNGYAHPQQQQSYYTARGGHPVSFQEYFGFDGIPFNGSHIQAFRRFHGRGF